MSDFENWAAEHKVRVERLMTSFVDRCTPGESRLADAVRYAVQTEGKRIRPLLNYAAAEALGVDKEIADYPAVAIEMVHTYSLVHDDLPAMDDDDLRRGKPTVHKAFDEATAILVGDALLTHSFEFLANAAVDPQVRAGWVTQLATSSGANGMIQGQATDLEGESRALSLVELESMHRRKTGALIEASLTMVSRVVDDSDAAVPLERFARHLGLAFQIRDDILDVEGSTETLGKPAGSDLANNKSTFVSLLGLEESKARLQAELQAAQESISSLHNAVALGRIADYVVNRDF